MKYLANLLSTFNGLCGILAIYLLIHFPASGQWLIIGAFLILLAQVFDMLDGLAARHFGSTKYGDWIDDIADAISFGLYPGFLTMYIFDFNFWGIILGVFFICCVFYRLYRFIKIGKLNQKGIFFGLPSPAGATLMVGLILGSLNVFWTFVGTLIICYLMISRVRFTHFGYMHLPGMGLIYGLAPIFLFLFYLIYTSQSAGFMGAMMIALGCIYAGLGLSVSPSFSSKPNNDEI